MFGKLVLALVTVGVVSAGMGYATFAFLSDTETASGNLFTVGNLDLKVNNLDGVTGVISALNLAPGDTATPGVLTLKNAGSIGEVSGHPVSLDFKTTVTQTDADAGTTDVSKFLQFVTFTYGATDLTASLPDANSNGIKDLDDLNGYVFTGLGDPGTGKDLTITLKLIDSAGNQHAGDEAEFSIEFFLRQSGETPLA